MAILWHTAPKNRCSRAHVCDSPVGAIARVCDRYRCCDHQMPDQPRDVFGALGRSKSRLAHLWNPQMTKSRQVQELVVRATARSFGQWVPGLFLRIDATVMRLI